MTVSISHAQADCLRRMARGENRSPPLSRSTLEALKGRGLVTVTIKHGMMYWFLTDAGRRYL